MESECPSYNYHEAQVLAKMGGHRLNICFHYTGGGGMSQRDCQSAHALHI